MNKTNIVIPTANVVGNIGSCQINSQDISISNFYTETVAVNSCDGKIIADHTYFNWGNVFAVGFLLVFVLAFCGFIMRMMKD